jgi:xanthine dehydrogenase accessory factor
MTSDIENMPEGALDWHRAGRGAALATVVETWGSAPRPVGAPARDQRRGRDDGLGLGGCVEGAVVAEALDALGTAARAC